MITTARVARFLRALPDADAAALLDAVVDVAADPLANPRRCKHLGPDLWEARVSLPPSRQFRCMFSYRRDGVPVLLSACLKTSNAVHEKAIRTARAALSSDDIPQGAAMPQEQPIFHVTSWVYAGTRQYRIVHHTRKKVIVQTDTGPVELRRSRLERDGFDHVNGTMYRTTKYALPHELEEQTA